MFHAARSRRLAVRLLLAILITGLVALLAFLPFAGRYLVLEQPLEHADAIVVLAGARVERWLEAVDLYRAGWAP
ncbi:MAG: YdcF family protein, partial [Acidobacteriota bacterium]